MATKRQSSNSPGRRPKPTLEDRILTAVMIGAAVLGLLGGLWAARERGQSTRGSPQRQLLDFTLVDQSGRTVRRHDLTNQVLVVNCMYTSCSASCRAVNDRMAEIQQAVAGQSNVLLVSLTLDPRSDTPATLARFASRYQADTNRWRFLTGDKDTLYPLIAHCFLERAPELDGMLPGGFTDMDRIFLIDRQGQVRGSFPGLKADTPRSVMRSISRLLAEVPRP